jgi:membrane protein YdbS with pleckstrin-like domain
MSESRSPSHSRTVYASAVDRWLALLLVFPIVGAIALGIVLLAMQRPGDATVLFAVAASILLVTGLLTIPCRYTLLDDTLSIRCGLICYQVPYDSMTKVKSGWTLKSGPALSLRRVIVSTGKRDYILSPGDREGFIANLQSRIHHTA